MIKGAYMDVNTISCFIKNIPLKFTYCFIYLKEISTTIYANIHCSIFLLLVLSSDNILCLLSSSGVTPPLDTPSRILANKISVYLNSFTNSD